MQTTSNQFKSAVVDMLRKVEGHQVHLDHIETGEGSMIAHGVLKGLPDGSGELSLPRPFVVSRHHDQLVLEVKMVTRVGSPGSLVNCALVDVMKTFFGSPALDVEDLIANTSSMRLFAHLYLASPHTPDEFIANLVDASNCQFVLSRALRDIKDGEVSVRLCVKCDYVNPPSDLEVLVDAVIVHTLRLVQLVRIAREHILPASGLEQNLLINLLLSANRGHANQHGTDASERESPVGQPML